MKKTGILLAAILVALVAIWWHAMNLPPVLKIPKHVMPKPNAYDVWVPAARSIKDSEKIGWAIRRKPPLKPSGDDRVYSLKEKEALVAENSGALSMLRGGLKLEYCNPFPRSVDTSYPELAGFRHMSQLLVLEGAVEAGKGHGGKAINCDLDAMEFGSRMVRGGAFIHVLVGIAIQAIGLNKAWNYTGRLSASEAKAAARRMEEIMAKAVPLSDAITEEKWWGGASLMDLMGRKDWVGSAMAIEGDPGGWLYNVGYRLRLARYSKRRIVGDYARYMDDLAASSRRPWAERRSGIPDPDDSIASIMCPVFSRADFSYTHRTTQNLLLMTTLALQAYKEQHGQYPDALDELVPGILKKVPDDPFGANTPFRYKKMGSRYILYSVGPDCKDDGGRAIHYPYDGSGTEPDSRGDIVAGVNRR